MSPLVASQGHLSLEAPGSPAPHRRGASSLRCRLRPAAFPLRRCGQVTVARLHLCYCYEAGQGQQLGCQSFPNLEPRAPCAGLFRFLNPSAQSRFFANQDRIPFPRQTGGRRVSMLLVGADAAALKAHRTGGQTPDSVRHGVEFIRVGRGLESSRAPLPHRGLQNSIELAF